jgi:hypothetical protein
MIAIVAAMITHTPAARPSTPSEKLTTFIIATNPSTVSTGPALVGPAFGKCSTPANGSVIALTATPKWTAITAASSWPASLIAGGRSKRSSNAPTSVITPAASSTPCQSLDPGSQISAATSAPAKIATPPNSGVARSDRPRSRGSSIAPNVHASRVVAGVRRAVTAAARRKA